MRGPVETEVKLRVAGPAQAREAVKKIGAVLSHERHFEDNVLLDDRAGSLQAAGGVLRLRRTSTGAVLTFKGRVQIVGGLKSREERETLVTDADEVEAILCSLGYRPIFRYQKYREAYTWGGQEIVIDETPIGSFFEIEGNAEGIRSAVAALGYGPSDLITDSYAALFFKGGGKGDMVFA